MNGQKFSEGIMKKFLTVSLVTLTLAQFSWAAGKGTSGGQFLRVGAGARAMGMAGAFSSLADDATAIYWNPAGMSILDKREVSLSYNAYFKDTSSQFASYAHPTSNGAVGIGMTLFSVKDIDHRTAGAGDSDTPDLGSFNTQDMALSLGYASRFEMGESKLHYGAALKYISSDLETEKAATGALDLGMLYRFHDEAGLGFSVSVLNLGGELKFDGEGDPLPLTVKPGISFRKDLGRMKLNAVLDSDILLNDDKAYVQPGFELWVAPSVALRTGYQFGRGDGAGSGVAAGLGVKVSRVMIDYAFVPYGDLGDTHRMSVGMKF